jgi:hypothetical protein
MRTRWSRRKPVLSRHRSQLCVEQLTLGPPPATEVNVSSMALIGSSSAVRD